jgi:squalene-associated FAD-dependent desaturase
VEETLAGSTVDDLAEEAEIDQELQAGTNFGLQVSMLQPPLQPDSTPRIAVIGGGLAGLAAAVAAVERGFQIELFEQAPAPGGRAGSFTDAKVSQLVDLSPHVAMGCCTNLLDFCRRTETSEAFDRYATLHFFGPDGIRYDFTGSRWLPAPLHLLPGLNRLGYLTGSQRRAIGRAMLKLAGTRPAEATTKTMGEWLRQQRQPEEAIRRFWALVLESALGDTLDRVSVAAARKVFVDGFLATRNAYEVLVPRVPLGEIWRRAGDWLIRRGAKLNTRTRVESLAVDGARVTGVVLNEGLCRPFDHVIAAVSWKQIGKLLGLELLKRIPRAEAGTSLQASPITAVHLWFDRPVMTLPHAAIVGRLSQWVFNNSRGQSNPGTFHYTVVISASHALVDRDSKEVLGEVLGDLQAIWPEAGEAKFVHYRVLTQPAAVFSVRPETGAMRPAQSTPVEGLSLAGDWTDTDWPATMEGAVRSGYLAIEALLARLGRPEPVLAPDLKKGWLVRWFSR